MKKFLSVAALTLLAAAAFAQSQVDASLAFQAPDLNKAPANKISGYGDQTSSKALNLDTNVKFTYTAKLDDSNTLKVGAAVDLYTPFYAGNKDKYKSQLAAKVVEPFFQYQGFGIDALTSLAVYTFSPSDTSSGTNALGFYTGPLFSAKKPAKDNTLPVSDYLKVSYKYAFDKTFSVTPAVEATTAIAPVLYLVNVKPQVTVSYLMTQTDFKYSLGFTSSNYDDTGASATTNTTKTTLEPKFTLDLGGLDASMKGFKAYVGGSFVVGNAAVLNGTTTNGKLTGSSVTPGVSYSGLAIPGVPGTFGADTSLKIGGIGPDDVADNTAYDFNLKCSYSVKF